MDHNNSNQDSIINDVQIQLLEKKLKEFNISMSDLTVYASGKYIDIRDLSIKLASIMANNKFLYEKLINKKSIPVADLVKVFPAEPKLIEKSKKLIVALSLIISREFIDLTQFIDQPEQDSLFEKGLVLSYKNNDVIVMTRDFVFKKLKRRKEMRIGQEVYVSRASVSHSNINYKKVVLIAGITIIAISVLIAFKNINFKTDTYVVKDLSAEVTKDRNDEKTQATPNQGIASPDKNDNEGIQMEQEPVTEYPGTLQATSTLKTRNTPRNSSTPKVRPTPGKNNLSKSTSTPEPIISTNTPPNDTNDSSPVPSNYKVVFTTGSAYKITSTSAVISGTASLEGVDKELSVRPNIGVMLYFWEENYPESKIEAEAVIPTKFPTKVVKTINDLKPNTTYLFEIVSTDSETGGIGAFTTEP